MSNQCANCGVDVTTICANSEDVTTSEELRAWAVYDRHADMNNLPYAAWNAMADWRLGHWCDWFDGPDHVRTFALLVACALEDE